MRIFTLLFITIVAVAFAKEKVFGNGSLPAFLKHFDLLSDKSGYHLLKGANAKVDQLASRIIKEKGESFLNDYAKMNF